MTNDELKQIEEMATGFAIEAGKMTLDYFKHGFSVDRKRDGSFVTAADRAVEAFLRAEISRYFPDDGILGEEEAEQPGKSGRRWIVDPIDGTFSFVHGVPFFGVLIALETEGRSNVGVINIPVLGELISASTGNGCTFNGKPSNVSTVSSLDRALLLATDFGVCAKYGFGEVAEKLTRQVAERRTWGDCYGYLLVATGRAEIMFDPVMNIWDCAALQPVIEEAGGTFTDWRGLSTISGGNAIATNGLLFKEVMDVIRS